MKRTTASLQWARAGTRSAVRNRFTTGLIVAAAAILGATQSSAQTDGYSKPIADSVVKLATGSRLPSGGDGVRGHPPGLLLEAMHEAWYNSANGAYFQYEKAGLDAYLWSASTGDTIDAQDSWEAGLLGNELLRMYEVTRDDRYYRAATSLDSRLINACRVNAAAQGPCMAEPFLAAYTSAFQHDSALPEIADQFQHWQDWLRTRSKGREDNAAAQTRWLVRARFFAALADALPNFRRDGRNEKRLVSMLKGLNESSHIEFSPAGGDRSNAGPATRIQATVTLLELYALLKGMRLGYLPPAKHAITESEWRRLVPQYPDQEAADGALLLASTEMDLDRTASIGRGQTVLLDAWFNSQQRQNAANQKEYFHYKWEDSSDSGYALLGHIFRSYGVSTVTLYTSPTRDALAKAQYYIIVSPDNPVKNPNPHYMTGRDSEEVAAWVSNGGVLVMLENDPPNADLAHLNLLADKFGIHFDDVLHHHVLHDNQRGDRVEDGAIPVSAGGPIFHGTHTLYMKDTCAISLTGSAQPLLRDRGDVVMASARYGKGMVFAAVDPWVYNEYTDGRKDPAIYSQFDNFGGATEFARWLIEQRNALATSATTGAK